LVPVLTKKFDAPPGDPPLQFPAPPQETTICSDKLRSVPGLLNVIKAFASSAAVAANAQQLPQAFWFLTGVT
jgi:hypothetical protein